MRTLHLLLIVLAASSLFGQCNPPGPTVRFETNLGIIDVLLLSDRAPRTVANFLTYVNRGAYTNTIFHRSVPGFVIQGGGFGTNLQAIPADPPVQNEYGVSNTRGTIAMAKLGNDANSATNQWFFNLVNNPSLNTTNGGFTVFGRIINEDGLSVMDRIAAVPVRAYDQATFAELPLQNYTSGVPTEANLVVVKSITVLDPMQPPEIRGVLSASAFGGFNYSTRGGFIEIYGNNLAGCTREWAQNDFTGNRAPTSLEGVIVRIDNVPAYPSFISPTQINVQVPQSVAANRAVPIVVQYRGQASAVAQFDMRPAAPGLLAPASFLVGSRQYIVAVRGGTVVGLPSSPAVPGETLLFFGTGFGPVTPNTFPYAGQIPTGQVLVTAPVEIHIGEVRAQVSYAGLAPGLVGLYQFNVVVPADVPAGEHPVRVVLGGETLPQALFLPVTR